jgi:hypothetical protein
MILKKGKHANHADVEIILPIQSSYNSSHVISAFYVLSRPLNTANSHASETKSFVSKTAMKSNVSKVEVGSTPMTRRCYEVQPCRPRRDMHTSVDSLCQPGCTCSTRGSFHSSGSYLSVSWDQHCIKAWPSPSLIHLACTTMLQQETRHVRSRSTSENPGQCSPTRDQRHFRQIRGDWSDISTLAAPSSSTKNSSLTRTARLRMQQDPFPHNLLRKGLPQSQGCSVP